MSSIIIMTFEDARLGEKALKVLESLRSQHLFEMSDAVVISKDFQGYVDVTETEDVKPKKGAVVGGIAGLVVGTLLGGPIGGALLGAAAGAVTSKAIDLGIPNAKIKEVSQALDKATSALLVELKEGDPQKLINVLKQTGGELYELTVSDDTKRALQDAVSDEDAQAE